MASVAYRQIISTGTARNPVPPEGASESDRNRLIELCGLLRRKEKYKDNLQARFQSANLRGMYHTKD